MRHFVSSDSNVPICSLLFRQVMRSSTVRPTPAITSLAAKRMARITQIKCKHINTSVVHRKKTKQTHLGRRGCPEPTEGVNLISEDALQKLYKPAAWWTNVCDVLKPEGRNGRRSSTLCNVSVSAACASWKNDLIRGWSVFCGAASASLFFFFFLPPPHCEPRSPREEHRRQGKWISAKLPPKAHYY